jgi:hypothetical protein
MSEFYEEFKSLNEVFSQQIMSIKEELDTSKILVNKVMKKYIRLLKFFPK